jgi:hypothetical protein
MLGSCDKMRPSVEVATSVFALDVHMVPAPVFASAQLDRMGTIMGAVCADFGCEPIEFNGRGQHTSTCSSPSPDGGAVPAGQ